MTDCLASASALEDDPDGASMQWCAVAPSGWRVERWEPDTSLFNHDTGETHLLGPLPAEVLNLIGQRPRSFSDLRAELAEACGVAVDQEWSNKVAQMLAGLALLELIEPHHPLAGSAAMSATVGIASDPAAAPRCDW